MSGGPVRYRRQVPIWTDEYLPGLAGSIRSGAVLAAVRNGTVGMPYGQAAVAPFMAGNWLFSHNGLIPGWPESTLKLAERLPVADLLRLDAPVDSALLWALIANQLFGGIPPADAVAAVVPEVEALAPGSRLNILLTDGEQLVATTLDPFAESTADRRLGDRQLGAVRVPATGPTSPTARLLVATATTLHITHAGRTE